MACEKYDRLTLISYYTGDITGVRREELDNHLTGCGACRNMLDEMRREHEAFLAAMPSWHFSRIPVAAGTGKRPVRHTVYALAASLVLMAGIATLMTDSGSFTSRVKGGEALHLFRAGAVAGTVERDVATLYTGERIQFTYSCDSKRYFILAGMDGTGEVSIYYPAAGRDTMLLEPGSDIPLPNSIELDEFIGRELFVGVFSDRPLSVDRVTAGLRRGFHDAGDLSSMKLSVHGGDCHTVIITKKERP